MKIHTWQPATAPVRWPWLCVAAFVVCFIISTFVPSFQAPDEFDHVDRAYMLSTGQLVLHSVNGSPSGGEVDDGLLEYMRFFTPLKGDGSRKFSLDEGGRAADVRWAGTTTFVTAVGTSYYFPALYGPQAVGLGMGRALGLSVGQSYQLARYLTLAVCFGLLVASFRLFAPPAIVLALLVLPMNLFLFSSAVLDGMATCTAVLVLSTFLRLVTDHERGISLRLVYTLAIAIALLSACRANLLPLLTLPFAVWWLFRTRTPLVLAIATAVFVLGWTMYTVKYTTYPPGARNIDHGARLIGYLLHPWEFGRIVFTTVTTPSIVNFYAVSFIGVLGWLDAPLPLSTYYAIAGLLISIAILSLSRRVLVSIGPARGLLAICAVGAVLMTFLALLVQWTVGPATTVDGVQGRYFMIPALILSYAMFADATARAGILEIIRTALTAVLFILVTHATIRLLVGRYYTPTTQPDPASTPQISPSPALALGKPITLHFSAAQVNAPVGLTSIAIRFGTYQQSHSGKAILILHTNGGDSARLPFELSDLEDNGYKQFSLDGKPYVGAQIISDGGQGVSTYEVRRKDAITVDCIQIHTTDGRVEIPGECPSP